MDLSSLEVPDTVTVHLEFPGTGLLYDDDKKTKPIAIELFGPATNEAINYGHKMQRKAVAKMGKRGLKSLKMSPEEMDQQGVERLCAFTASVSNLTYNSKKMTPETMSEVYSDPKMGWLCDQLNEKLGSWDDFLA